MEKTPIKILGAEPYDKVRELCHQKEMSADDYVKLIGDRFYPFLPEKSVLIPVPGHDGTASHTLQLLRHPCVNRNGKLRGWGREEVCRTLRLPLLPASSLLLRNETQR